jgi:hypothetical protein
VEEPEQNRSNRIQSKAPSKRSCTAVRVYNQKSSVEQVDPTLAAPTDNDLASSLEMREAAPTAQEVLEAWDLDMLGFGHVRPGLKPLTADELEFLLTTFPDVMPHVYVRPNAILFGTEAKEGYLMEVAREDLGFPGDVPIQILYARSRIDVWQWCGGIGRTMDVLAFNNIRVKALRQTLAPFPRGGGPLLMPHTSRQRLKRQKACYSGLYSPYVC